MKDYIKSAKSGLIFGISALLIFVLGASVYAGWTSISKVKSSDTLKANEWNTVIDNMQYLDGRINGGLVIPSGLVSAFYLESCPTGWKAADGTDHTIDLRGKLIRGINNFGGKGGLLSGDDSDEDRGDSAGLGSYQEDAIRNITGGIGGYLQDNSWPKESGAFTKGNLYNYSPPVNYSTKSTTGAGFDASASEGVIVGKDNRPKNVGLIYCVKE